MKTKDLHLKENCFSLQPVSYESATSEHSVWDEQLSLYFTIYFIYFLFKLQQSK